MGTLDMIGTLIGGPLWPAIYRVGLKLGGVYVGLPFMVATAMFALVFVSVEVVKYSIPDFA